MEQSALFCNFNLAKDFRVYDVSKFQWKMQRATKNDEPTSVMSQKL